VANHCGGVAQAVSIIDKQTIMIFIVVVPILPVLHATLVLVVLGEDILNVPSYAGNEGVQYWPQWLHDLDWVLDQA